MQSNLEIPLSQVLGALLTFVRVSSVFVFVPIPGASAARSSAKAVMALATTAALAQHWPIVDVYSPARILAATACEAALGVAVGLVISLMTEFLLLAFQTLSLQAGYSFASTIDPTTQADSGILQMFAQLTGGLLFFAFGLHRDVIATFTTSLTTLPAGQFALKAGILPEMIRLGSLVFATGLRLALPVIAFLMVVDVSLALMGRINAQLQLILLAFPLKMAATLVLLSILMLVIPPIYRQFANSALSVVAKLVSG